jgi:hypothetical protein
VYGTSLKYNGNAGTTSSIPMIVHLSKEAEMPLQQDYWNSNVTAEPYSEAAIDSSSTTTAFKT